MTDTTDRDIDAAASLHDFLTLFLDHRARGEQRELAWYLLRFPGDDVAVAREYLALTAVAGERAERLFAGRYEVLRELGRGGQGVVSLARDTVLNRTVALKTIDAVGRGLERLRREAEIASSLDHPGICAIYEANFEHTPAYVAMRPVEGQPLSRLLARGRERHARPGESGGEVAVALPLPPRTMVEVDVVVHTLERVARALHVAHESGIVHRDIKPGNLIITPEGEPVVLDFGLARQTQSDIPSITLTGEALGTPAYMSPEQLRGEALDATTDVYALGVMLYECLTLVQPFDRSSRSAIEAAVLHGAPARPSSLNRAVPRELDAVVAVALDRSARSRYASAERMAEDLRRVRAREPILASPPGLARRTARWIQRNPRVAASMAVLTALLVLVASLFVTARQRGTELSVELLAREATQHAATNPAYAFAVASEAHRRAPNTQSSNDALLQALIYHRDQRVVSRDHHWAAMDWEGDVCVSAQGTQLMLHDSTTWAPAVAVDTGVPIERLELSPDGARVLVGDATGRVGLWDLERREELAGFTPSDAAVTLLAANWARGQVVSGDADGRLLLWSLEGDGDVRELHDYPAAVSDACRTSAGGRRLVSFSWMYGDELADSVAHVWDTEDGRLLQTLEGHQGPLLDAAFSSDGAWLATASLDRSARVWDLATGRCVATLEHPGKVLAVDFGRGGRTLATGCDPGDLAVESGDTAFVWDWQTAPRAPRLVLGQSGRRSTYAVGHDPSGERLVTGNLDGNAILWDAATGEELDRCNVADQIIGLRWGRDGEQLLIWSRISRYAWRLARRPPRPLSGHTGPVLHAGFSRDGTRALTASADATARVWDVASGRCVATLEHADIVRTIAESPTDGLLLTGCDDGRAVLWRGAEPAVTLGPHRGAVTRAGFLGDDRVITASDAGELRLWDTAGTLLRDWVGHRGPIQQVRVGPRGELVVSAGSDRSLRVWAIDRDEPTSVIEAWNGERGGSERNRVFDVVFSDDGQELLSVGEDTVLRNVSLRSGGLTERFSYAIGGHVGKLAGGRVAVSSKWSGSVSLWPFRGGVTERRHDIHAGIITSLTVSPDDFVLTTSGDGTGFLFRVEDGEFVPHMRLTGHADHLTHGAFSPDGRLVITASLDGTARLWPVHPADSGISPRPFTEVERKLLDLDLGVTR